MKDNNITEAQLLLNQEIKVRFGPTLFSGLQGHVNGIMADGRTLDVTLSTGQMVFLDVTLVREVQDTPTHLPQEQSLGPIANSVMKGTL
tara:strand:+ start:235 stop:501 length:267 start_codon:yes stop_codon:yes gene_type:complete